MVYEFILPEVKFYREVDCDFCSLRGTESLLLLLGLAILSCLSLGDGSSLLGDRPSKFHN